jgi:hypothetical protein
MGTSEYFDLGAHSTAQRVKNLVQKGEISGVLHVGDIAYARSIGLLWDKFMNEIEPIASSAFYHITIGNHGQ